MHTLALRFTALSLVAVSLVAGGCILPPSDDAAVTASEPSLHPPGTPIGPVASDAAEAWPNRPSQPPPLTATEIAEGCAAWATCQTSQTDLLNAVQGCIGEVGSMAERAIPLSFGDLGGPQDERAEFFVRCAAKSAGSCAELAGCLTLRAANYDCQEDGCVAGIAYTTSCQGAVATMTRKNGKQDHRDCSRAFAACDPSSETGCHDRLFTQCDPTKTRADRCDGDIRLGCDGAGQVSYHDCARLGGTCGALPGGGQGCVYPIDPACPGGADHVECKPGKLDVCVAGRHASVTATAVCP